MRGWVVGIGLALAGCTEMATPGTGPALGAAPIGAQQAYFPSYPENLFFAAAAVCDGPGQTTVSRTRNELRCESLPDPESAAALILQFNGTVDELPKFVISFAGVQTEQGYLVTADNFIRVPQRSGGAQQIRIPNQQVSAQMAELLAAAGGRPL